MFCFKFARSTDLAHWEKLDRVVFTGVNHEYHRLPGLRYFAPYYYVIYLHAAVPGHKGWISFLARSRDLATWELSPFNPILEAGPGEGINNSDVDLFESKATPICFTRRATRPTWGCVRVAMFAGSLRGFRNPFPDCLPP